MYNIRKRVSIHRIHIFEQRLPHAATTAGMHTSILIILATTVRIIGTIEADGVSTRSSLRLGLLGVLLLVLLDLL